MKQLRAWLSQFALDTKEKNIQQVWFLYRPYLLGIFVVFVTVSGLGIYGLSQVFQGRQGQTNALVVEAETDEGTSDLLSSEEHLSENVVVSSSAVGGTASEISREEADEEADEESETIASSAANETWYVDIKGAVKIPQVVPVIPGMRVHDVVEMAGGVTGEADQSQVNLAQLVTDQMVIYVPKMGEEVSPSTEALVADSQVTESDVSVRSGDPNSDGGLVNINTADATMLQTLSGIGEKRAADIINYRETNGLFETIDDLDQVSGIGEKTMEKLRPLITVD
ncbi:competence protein ComEA [Aerococcus sp. 150760007-1]|uniref:Helix-hairpin-helix domain-containing protein n=2 Tax=Lactobacillales TaxID=186826 RepID=A0ABR5ZXH7_9LACT|nr:MULTISPECIES: helix-hairpin-helix domain-containing protein [Lactobacillales]KAF3301211.1 competence protein comEA [Carnobacterium sp. PL26RED25]KAF3305457.1 competence protein comEA [Carnobacterium sp. PL24RED07]MBA5746418.1 helix-hairpin-helix domain-containing protein [Aerococcus urinaeequi]MBA5829202.1 helix-hairpin-helix domain-containing protein [Aerococcus urinaeequi]MBA5860189.1 helix-hairpin-helix domain-containing protein [Aerococcus urinaeequi]